MNSKTNKQILQARLVALDVLLDIFKQKQALDTSFDTKSKDLSAQDKKFSFALLNFVLRHTAAIDAVICQYMDKPFKPNSIERQILRIGLAQLFFMESVEEFACIHTTVELAKIRAKSSFKVINAVLRTAQEKAFDFLEENDELMYQVPAWLDEVLTRDYPQKAASIKSAMLKQGKVYVRLRARPAQEFLKKNAFMVKHLTGAWELKQGVDVNTIPKLEEFSVYVQDIASQLVGYTLAAKIEQDGKLEDKLDVLDMCAAPGGKTIQLVDMLPYANITACDNNANRLKTLESNLQNACPDDQARLNIVLNDATKPDFKEQSFDYILLDAPCSGLGISRKHIDVLHLRTPEEVKSVVELQKQILPKAFNLLKPGGVMMYSTCSLLKDEGEHQVNEFLKNNDKATIINIEDVYHEFGKITKEGFLRTFPTENIDGFFMALIQKNK
jgi:16S rRNA (cytosine967-C5)-methyltransferase